MIEMDPSNLGIVMCVYASMVPDTSKSDGICAGIQRNREKGNERVGAEQNSENSKF